MSALLISLALHMVLLGYGGDLDMAATPPSDVPIQARLVALDTAQTKPAAQEAALPPSGHARARSVPKAKSAPSPESVTPVLESSEAVESTAVMAGQEPPVADPEPRESKTALPPDAPAGAGDGPPVPGPEVAPEPEPSPSVPGRPAHRTLPERVVIRYGVHYGQDQFKAGEAHYQWYQGGGSYTLAASAETTGLISLFVSGRIVQNSEGRVGPAGLQPLRYAVRQGDKRQDVARFEWEQDRIILSRRSDPISLGGHAQAQDLLSFAFHLAMTAREGEAPFDLGISDGRKYQNYRFDLKGVERLALGYGQVETLRLEGRQADGGLLWVWLERGGYGLPVQIRTQDATKGTQIVLKAESVEM